MLLNRKIIKDYVSIKHVEGQLWTTQIGTNQRMDNIPFAGSRLFSAKQNGHNYNFSANSDGKSHSYQSDRECIWKFERRRKVFGKHSELVYESQMDRLK